MVFLVVISIISLIIFLKIPLNFKILIENTHIIIKLYNFTLFDTLKKNKVSKNIKNKSSKRKFTSNISLPEIQEIFQIISSNRFKPSIKHYLYLHLGLEDACNLALLYGSLYNFSPIMYALLNMVFNIKDYDFIITPHFNQKILNVEIKSIIYVSIANIIYIGTLISIFFMHNKFNKTKSNKFKEA